MRRTILFVALLMGLVAAQAQNAKLSPRTVLLAQEISQGKCTVDEVHAFAILVEGVDLKALDAYGVKVNSQVGNMATVQIPTKRFADFVVSGLCSYIDMGQKVIPMNDKARTEMGVDYIHQGVNLPQGYDGTGVIVGIIDGGFEYGHPSFYDTTGTTLRIKRVWQQRDTTGTNPDGFSYGSEYTTVQDILGAITDNPNKGHGSHVAGIAAGCGAPDMAGRRYSGMAPAADIVMVACNMNEVGIMDGIKYIHEYARQEHKPCVINLSLGTLIGPHDGMSSSDVMLADYLNQLDSIVVVVSAANSGNSNNHLHHQFSATDTIVRTYCVDLILGDYSASLDCWGAQGDEFSIAVALNDMDMSSGTMSTVEETPFVSTTIDSTYTFELHSSVSYDSVYLCDISVTNANILNNRPEILVDIHKSGRRVSGEYFSLTVKSTTADVHVWSDDYDFMSIRNNAYTQGDAEYTIGGFGANTDAVISVGSYATRTKRLTESGNIANISTTEEGTLSGFSSHGPTYDGRVKPDICAPGQHLVSSINTPYLPTYGMDYDFDSVVFNGQTYHYAIMQGTSMSSPAAAGVVALWLQNTPSLNVDTVRTIMHASGRTDYYTGDLPAAGSNLWGWGKIDPFAGLPATTVPMYQVDAVPDDYMQGYVVGGGRHPQGPHTVTAYSVEGYAFSHWSDGNSDNPHEINLTSDVELVAYFVESACDTIRQFPWVADFEGSALTCWEMNKIVGASEWTYLAQSMVSISVDGNIDNWMISPYIRVAEGTSLIFDGASRVHDSLAIMALTGNDTILLADEYFTDTTGGIRYVSLNPVAGRTIRIGFHHHASTASGFVRIFSAKVDYYEGIEGAAAPTYRVNADGLRFTVSGAPKQQLSVYDAMGRCVVSSPEANGTFTMPASGVYVLRIGNQPPRKIVLVK